MDKPPCTTCHEAPCGFLTRHAEEVSVVATTQEAILAELKLLREDQKVMKDIIVMTKNVKGFIATMKTVAVVLGWVLGFVAAVAGVVELMRHLLGVR